MPSASHTARHCSLLRTLRFGLWEGLGRLRGTPRPHGSDLGSAMPCSLPHLACVSQSPGGGEPRSEGAGALACQGGGGEGDGSGDPSCFHVLTRSACGRPRGCAKGVPRTVEAPLCHVFA